MSGALLPVLHAGHWHWDALFAAPAILLALALGAQALRRRARGQPPPDDLEHPEPRDT